MFGLDQLLFGVLFWFLDDGHALGHIKPFQPFPIRHLLPNAGGKYKQCYFQNTASEGYVVGYSCVLDADITPKHNDDSGDERDHCQKPCESKHHEQLHLDSKEVEQEAEQKGSIEYCAHSELQSVDGVEWHGHVLPDAVSDENKQHSDVHNEGCDEYVFQLLP